MKNYLAEFSANTTPSEVPKVPKGAFGTFGTSPGVGIEVFEESEESEKDLPPEVPKVPKVPEGTMAATLIREAEARGWEVEFISTKNEVPPLPKEIRFELVERGFPLSRVLKMSHGEAAFHLFRDGGPGWR